MQHTLGSYMASASSGMAVLFLFLVAAKLLHSSISMPQ